MLREMRVAIGVLLALGAAAGLACAAIGLLISGQRGRGLPANAGASVNGTVIRLEEYDRAVEEPTDAEVATGSLATVVVISNTIYTRTREKIQHAITPSQYP